MLPLAWTPRSLYGADSHLVCPARLADKSSQANSPALIFLERLHKLEQHQGFVKGVCWDPVGEFLATQSDDRSVKIWRTIDWKLEAEVRKPFEDSPGSTFFRRLRRVFCFCSEDDASLTDNLSWSPDGAHITASNATNNKGLVFIAAVITRNSWTSDISLVGHENTVEVAVSLSCLSRHRFAAHIGVGYQAYNPHIFLRNPSSPVATSNICSVVALGADDRSVSVWQTKSARPLIVAREVFDRQIMDLSWYVHSVDYRSLCLTNQPTSKVMGWLDAICSILRRHYWGVQLRPRRARRHSTQLYTRAVSPKIRLPTPTSP